MNRRTFLSSAAIAASMLGAASVLSACGSDERGPATRRVRVVAIGNPADALDPAGASAAATYIALYAVYESLAVIVDGEVQMQLAEAITPNDDASEWTIRLVSDARFSDGSPVTSRDVLASFAHYADSPTLGPFFTDVDLSATRAADDHTIALVLKRPRADLIMSMLAASSVVMKNGDPALRIGSGPFRVDQGSSAQGWSLARVDPDDGRSDVLSLQVSAVSEPQARTNAVTAGQAQFAVDLTPTAARQIQTHKNLRVDRTGPADSKALGVILNTRVAPFDDPEVRLAAKLTLDRKLLVDSVLQGFGTVGNDLLGLGLPTYPTDLPQRSRDVDRARAIFARKHVTRIPFTVAEVSSGVTAAAESMVRQFAEVGVTLDIRTADPASYFADMPSLFGQPMFVTYYVNRSTVSALPFVTGTDGFFNLSGFGGGSYDALLQRISAEVDESARQQLIDEAAKIVWSDSGEIIWGYQEVVNASVSDLHDVRIVQSVPVFGAASFE
ncbi:ABC transporter substrate-binding protein [Gordonia humi]|uniref:Peptide/nickel transport system substrate-binding protein n=1 Tax=Gordonia humi TaxID=686429 RepID=A0A840EXH7_9ACTN|nr:ABC transporter substrate-binding protein [Gordonia humi]MBB4136291.1 peptide/nickel transport system substrate-binding protein [Gordonia humi]